ncbi:Alpha/Beta hydrolase protein [Cunninghamella echinulata]|nr:Alpha/Beta hydrolase protein [Cunninghamella echinulata]
MAWFDSRTLFLSISLFCLPALVVCAVLCLPLLIFLIITFYIIAWIMYLLNAQTDTEFNLPYNPTKVLKINLIILGHLVSWIKDTPMILHYLYWRYWKVGTKQFKHIVSLDIPYSNASKECLLDVYHPDHEKKGKRPVIVFIYGGSWSSGQKILYRTFANTLRELGYIVVVPDYRKYPIVKADSMYNDVRNAIKWTFEHVNDIGADVDMIYVMGHSAGAHLACQVVISDLIEKTKHASLINKRKLNGEFFNITETDFLPQVEGLLLFAGVYSIEEHYKHESARGVEKISAMGRAMGSTIENFSKNSPLDIVKANADLFAKSDDLLDFAPRIIFIHGEKDITVPIEQSFSMYNMLGEVLPPSRRDEVDVRMKLYKKMNHAECVTALMPRIFSENKMRKSLIRDIVDFLDVPSLDEGVPLINKGNIKL